MTTKTTASAMNINTFIAMCVGYNKAITLFSPNGTTPIGLYAMLPIDWEPSIIKIDVDTDHIQLLDNNIQLVYITDTK